MFPGHAHEPILLHINYPRYRHGSEEDVGDGGQRYDDSAMEMAELNCGFPKDSALLHLRVNLESTTFDRGTRSLSLLSLSLHFSLLLSSLRNFWRVS